MESGGSASGSLTKSTLSREENFAMSSEDSSTPEESGLELCLGLSLGGGGGGGKGQQGQRGQVARILTAKDFPSVGFSSSSASKSSSSTSSLSSANVAAGTKSKLGFLSFHQNQSPMKLAGLKSIDDAHDESVWAVTWVPATDSRPALLLTGSLDETVRLWQPDELVNRGKMTGHCLGVASVAAHPSGRIAASASLDSFVRIFDVDTNNTVASLEAPPSEVWQLRFNPQGTMLAVAGGGSASVKVWDTATWNIVATLSIPRPEGTKPTDKSSSKKFVLSVAWSPDGRRIACGSMDGTVSVFDTDRAKFLHHLEGHFMPVRSLVFSPVEARLLFTGSDDAHVHMYDAEGKTLVGAMSGHAGWVLSVDVSSDGAAVATGSSDRTVRLWDISMRGAVQTMSNHTDQVWGVAFRPGGMPGRLASVSDDKSISLYDYS